MPPKLTTVKQSSDAQTTSQPDKIDTENQFEMELEWCIRQLDLGLLNQKPDSRQAAEAIKVLKILRSDKSPLVKKRQAMRNTFGDYRLKMKEEEKKNASKMKKLKVTPVTKDTHSKSQFYKKSLKTANESYVASMASMNVNQDITNIDDSDISRLDSQSLEEKSSGFKFGFAAPSGEEKDESSANSEMNNIDNTDSCQSQNGNHDIETKFVMQKSHNCFRFNFDEPT